MFVSTPALLHTSGDQKFQLNRSEHGALNVSLWDGSKLEQFSLDPTQPKNTALTFNPDEIEATLVSTWHMAWTPGARFCSEALKEVLHSGTNQRDVPLSALKLDQRLQFRISSLGAIPASFKLGTRSIPRVSDCILTLFDDGMCQLLESMCKQDPQSIPALLKLPIQMFTPTPQWIHFVDEHEVDTIYRRIEFPGLLGALEEIKKDLVNGRINIEKNLAEKLAARIADTPVFLIPVYHGGSTPPPRGPCVYSELQAVLEKRGRSGVARGYLVHPSSFQSEQISFEYDKDESAATGATLEEALCALDIGEQTALRTVGENTKLADRIGKLSVADQAALYAGVAGMSDFALRNCLPIEIPAYVHPYTAPFAALDPYSLDFCHDRGSSTDSRYRSTTYRWNVGRVQVGEDTISARLEVRIHTKVSDNLSNTPPSCVVTLYLRKGREDETSWVLMNLSDRATNLSAIRELGQPLLELANGSVWFSGERKKKYHHLVAVSDRNAKLYASQGEAMKRNIEAARALFQESLVVTPLLHFPVIPEFHPNQRVVLLSTLDDRLNALEQRAVHERRDPPQSDPSTRDFLALLVRENPEQSVLDLGYMSVSIVKNEEGFLITARFMGGERSQIFQYSREGLLASSEAFSAKNFQITQDEAPSQADATKILDAIAKLRVLQHLLKHSLPYKDVAQLPGVAEENQSNQETDQLGAEFEPLLTAMANPRDRYGCAFPIDFAMNSLKKYGYFVVKDDSYFTIGGTIQISEFEHVQMTYQISYGGVIRSGEIRINRKGNLDPIPLNWPVYACCRAMLREVQAATLGYLEKPAKKVN